MDNLKRKILAALVLAFGLQTAWANPNLVISAALVAGSSTNATVPLGAAFLVGVQVTTSNNAASTDTTVVTVAESNDGIIWTPRAEIDLTNAGTLTSTCTSNFTTTASELQLTLSNTTADATVTNWVRVAAHGKGRSNP